METEARCCMKETPVSMMERGIGPDLYPITDHSCSPCVSGTLKDVLPVSKREVMYKGM